ncbi:MAG: NADH-quinone oxidoreductase subunit C [Actinomycetota bacterium]
MSPEDLVAAIAGRFPDALVARGQAVLEVDRGDLRDALAYLAEEPLGLGFLSNVTATDWPEASPRFWVAYELLSIAHRHRLRVKVGVPGDDPHVPSVVDRFPTADWHERETYDFYGIMFDGHPDLRRILLPDAWEGHPLRKTEDLGGVNTRYRGAFIPPVDRRNA